MGALTITPAINTQHNAGDQYRMTGTITMSSSYSTGGDTGTSLELGLGLLEDLILDQGELTSTTSVMLVPVYGTPGYNATFKIQAFWTGSSTSSALIEVTSTTNLSGLTVKYSAIGV